MKREFSIQKERIKQVLEILLRSITSNKTEELELLPYDSDHIFEVVDAKTEKKKHSEASIQKVKEISLRATVTYLQKYLDPKEFPKELNSFFSGTFKVDGVKLRTIPGCKLLHVDPNVTLKLDTSCHKKLLNTKLFNSESIFNIQQYVKEFFSVVAGYEYEITRTEFEEIVQPFKNEFETTALNCQSQCPSCGKLCERKLHPHIGKCYIRTGHRICSMGGKVWENDVQRHAIVSMCDDYSDETMVTVPGCEMSWGKFKDKSRDDWDWTIPQDEASRKLTIQNRQNIIAIWNKFGKGILEYYESRNIQIQFTPYRAFDNLSNKHVEYDVCFVLDGTGSMGREIDKARVSIGQLISYYQKHGNPSKFGIVIYRDHCDGQNIIQRFPDDSELTLDYQSVAEFLRGVKVSGGGDEPEAVLDGLATAVNKYKWVTKPDNKNIIIHIYDAPPHGGLPNFQSHTSASNKTNCCCCNQGTLCNFDWERDVWRKMWSSLIRYHGISTGKDFPEFEATMKAHLGKLCGEFQKVGKELVNDAVVKIFIDYGSMY